MKKISLRGLELAKRVFQIHGVDGWHRVVVQKQLRRAEALSRFSQQEPCLVGMEPCATTHYWAREIRKLGHDIKLRPPTYLKPYVQALNDFRARIIYRMKRQHL